MPYSTSSSSDAPPISFEDVEGAAERIAGSVVETPFLHSRTLSELSGAEVWLKFENLQFSASFKERGALNKLLTLNADQRRQGVIAASAGNHAQGVALHARRLGIPATIVMPTSTPSVKVIRTESFGARVILSGGDLAQSLSAVPALVESEGLTFIHPFDDPLIMAGQGTVGLEIIAQGPQLDAMVVAVGGGGLISGIATVFAALSPSTQIVGVESATYPSLAIALGQYEGELPGGPSVAEGIAVAKTGGLPLRQLRNLVSDVVVVSEAAIEDAVALLLEVEKTLCEGAGAASLAAVLAARERFKGKRVGLVLSGGNIDSRVLIAMLQRHLVRTGHLVRIDVTALDSAGALAQAASVIARHGGNVLDVSHERAFAEASARSVSVRFDVELSDPEVAQKIESELKLCGLQARMKRGRIA